MDEPKKSPTLNKRANIVIVAILLIVLGIAVFIKAKNSESIIGSLFTNPKEILSHTNGLTNLVFMGIGGEGHEASNLTDSMIFISINHDSAMITTLSIPRDIWVDSMKAKINTAYYYGKERRAGGGIDLAKSAVSEVTGQPIHYAVVLDFSGFIKTIDSVGGIEVDVERSFDDYKYPIPGKENAEPESDRYEYLHFDAGLQRMDGARALKFARSRYAQGDEGTDFARSARQNKIVLAFIDKVFSTETFLNPSNITSMVDNLQDSISSDISKEEIAGFLKLSLNWKDSGKKLSNGSLKEYLINPKDKSPYDGQWVLVPLTNWQEIHDYIKELL